VVALQKAKPLEVVALKICKPLASKLVSF